jgi:4-hydroxyphenylpyruvate dioxygenase
MSLTNIPTTPQKNDLGLNGFAFVEYAGPIVQQLKTIFEQLGLKAWAKHKLQNIIAYKQNQIVFLLNEEKDSFAHEFSKAHGPSACGMGFITNDANKAFKLAIKRGGKPFEFNNKHSYPPTINGIGNSALYLVDENNNNWLEKDFTKLQSFDEKQSKGLIIIDHLTHNVYQGNMDKWAQFYNQIFNFHQIRYFDIEGQKTGLKSRALSSPCGKIKIPLNESKDDVSQIEEYLKEYKGEGIQHIALTTANIYDSVSKISETNIEFLSVPDTYYEALDQRIPNHGEPLDELRQLQLLVDGAPQKGEGLLLQIFTQNAIGPIFFEIIQRKGNDGFGEGNFTALFEAIERDQIRRGVL